MGLVLGWGALRLVLGLVGWCVFVGWLWDALLEHGLFPVWYCSAGCDLASLGGFVWLPWALGLLGFWFGCGILGFGCLICVVFGCSEVVVLWVCLRDFVGLFAFRGLGGFLVRVLV